MFKHHTSRNLCVKEAQTLSEYVHVYQGHHILDRYQGLSIDYVPELKHRIINESQDNSNDSDLNNDLAEFTRKCAE